MPDRETARREASPLLIAGTVLAVIAALAAAFALAVIVFEVRRAIVRRRREARCASDDQSVAVPALFEDAVRLMLAGNVAVDPARPYEAAASVEQAFPSVARDEYERAVALMQKSVFGGRELRAHEMRVLRRFNERLRHDLRPPENIRGMLVQRYRLGV